MSTTKTSIIILIVLIVVLVVTACLWNSSDKKNTDDKKIVENFPQTTPMNVMYSDSNGNLGTTTDLGLQHLTVNGDSSIGNSLTVNSRNILNELDSIKADLASTKTTLSNTNTDLASTKTLLNTTKTTLDALVKRGTIVMWNGGGNTVPSGWALCDGGNGTPNLQGRFVLSQGNSGVRGSSQHNVNETGGEETHQLTVNEMPPHTHPINLQGNNNDYHTNFRWGGDLVANNTEQKIPLMTGSTGGNVDHNNMPPFYVLAYIMKL